MSQSEEWANQRLALLRNHLQEWKTNVLQEVEARKELVSKHQLEKANLNQRVNTLEWAHYLTHYVERLTNLAIINKQRRQALQMRHEQETADLEERISTER